MKTKLSISHVGWFLCIEGQPSLPDRNDSARRGKVFSRKRPPATKVKVHDDYDNETFLAQCRNKTATV